MEQQIIELRNALHEALQVQQPRLIKEREQLMKEIVQLKSERTVPRMYPDEQQATPRMVQQQHENQQHSLFAPHEYELLKRMISMLNLQSSEQEHSMVLVQQQDQQYRNTAPQTSPALPPAPLPPLPLPQQQLSTISPQEIQSYSDQQQQLLSVQNNQFMTPHAHYQSKMTSNGQTLVANDERVRNRQRVMQTSRHSPLQDKKQLLGNSAPFATTQQYGYFFNLNIRDEHNVPIASLEKELMELSLEKDALEREYQKLTAQGAKTMSSRRRKIELEEQIEKLTRDSSRLRMKLREIK